MSFDVTFIDDDEKNWNGVKSGARLDEGGGFYKGSSRLWLRDGERRWWRY